VHLPGWGRDLFGAYHDLRVSGLRFICDTRDVNFGNVRFYVLGNACVCNRRKMTERIDSETRLTDLLFLGSEIILALESCT